MSKLMFFTATHDVEYCIVFVTTDQDTKKQENKIKNIFKIIVISVNPLGA